MKYLKLVEARVLLQDPRKSRQLDVNRAPSLSPGSPGPACRVARYRRSEPLLCRVRPDCSAPTRQRVIGPERFLIDRQQPLVKRLGIAHRQCHQIAGRVECTDRVHISGKGKCVSPSSFSPSFSAAVQWGTSPKICPMPIRQTT